MEMMPEHMGYDRAIVVFSPDGRLFQVEYAREAVKRGATAVGIVFKDGVVLAAKRGGSALVRPGEKIFQIDDHIGTVTSGLIADARVLVDAARVKSQQNRLIYDEPISVTTMARYIADRQQLYTQHAGVRPFGVSLLVGGMNKKPELYETDPSGILLECKARALGRAAEKINTMLEKEYRPDMDKKTAVKMAVSALKKEGKLKSEQIVLSVIDKDGFSVLDSADVKKLG